MLSSETFGDVSHELLAHVVLHPCRCFVSTKKPTSHSQHVMTHFSPDEKHVVAIMNFANLQQGEMLHAFCHKDII